MSDNLTAIVTQSVDFSVSSVGIQSIGATETKLELLKNVDASVLNDGSTLIYNTDTQKWVTSTLLDKQFIDCGEY